MYRINYRKEFGGVAVGRVERNQERNQDTWPFNIFLIFDIILLCHLFLVGRWLYARSNLRTPKCLEGVSFEKI